MSFAFSDAKLHLLLQLEGGGRPAELRGEIG